MAKKFKYDVIHRWEGNPLITIDDIPFPCNTVFNAACAKYKGQYILLLRIEDLTGRSIFALARSEDGYHFEVEPEPAMTPCTEEGYFKEYEKKGIEDPRITEIDGVFYIMYTACLLYTSDAADDTPCVDLGGRRIHLLTIVQANDRKKVQLVYNPKWA